jgi:hypothetical protein
LKYVTDLGKLYAFLYILFRIHYKTGYQSVDDFLNLLALYKNEQNQAKWSSIQTNFRFCVTCVIYTNQEGE